MFPFARLIIFGLAVFVFWQVILPGVMGRPVFSIFRRRKDKAALLAEIDTLRERLDEEHLKVLADNLRHQIEEEARKKEEREKGAA